ncbi:uncharacterized protein Gasu_26100 [Galdieria sulphuraria]|uniref:Uncharacterized protein n=1 Tax=Galdieria sulphuraria TaxID=130081 RepID=M2Y225_GALSU|nr:uncharacterized protein Gasu_26100 [Galdieria sulphuraria]EME30023.1 hypothetical protein Gasu_26100 [Galdieria sulphuraria]|eukprot:XP_005706543.1 hypothetical protein Gasu_26100 [Galdieria sulphuraria]
MSHKKRNKPIGGKEGVVFDRPVPKFLQSYVQSPTEQVDGEAKWERQTEEVNVQQEIANLRKQGFHIEPDPCYTERTLSSSTMDQPSNDSWKQSESKESPNPSPLLDNRKGASPSSRGRNQTIANIGIRKRQNTTSNRVTQKENKKLSTHRAKVVDRQLLSFQEQDE